MRDFGRIDEKVAAREIEQEQARPSPFKFEDWEMLSGWIAEMKPQELREASLQIVPLAMKLKGAMERVLVTEATGNANTRAFAAGAALYMLAIQVGEYVGTGGSNYLAEVAARLLRIITKSEALTQ